MNILVVDVAASESGAVTILKEYYNKYAKDKDNKYFFCVSTVELENTDNIEVLSFAWVKKSWFHRLWFEHVLCPKLIKKYSIEKIVSLQNTLIYTKSCETMLYLHLPIPFVEYKYKITEEPLFWVYQNVIYRLIRTSVKNADQIIVQTEWMRAAVAEKCGVSEEKIIVEHPTFDIKPTAFFTFENWNKSFLYPATNYSYKNHIVIFQAVKKLLLKGVRDFKVHLTLEENELPATCKAMYEEVKDVIICEGRCSHDELMLKYAQSVLVFPSFIETFGLPLLEARMCDDFVIASNTPFAREILDGYDNCCFFQYDDTEELACIMEKLLKK